MHPRLIKVQIPKATLAERQRVSNWLRGIGKDALMPKERSIPDAMRVAISYVLRDWQSWKGEDGTSYKAIAAAPTEQRGLQLSINVQIRKPDGVQYSETVCRLEAEEGNKFPARIGGTPNYHFEELYRALNPTALLDLGRDHLFDSDLRALAESLLEGSIDKLWTGVWLCLTEAPALEEVTALGTLVCAGSVTLSTLTLDQSQANRLMLAEELAKEYLGQLGQLTRRLGLTKPNLERIETDYMTLCGRIRSAEEMLGVPVPMLSEQVTFEEALASTQA